MTALQFAGGGGVLSARRPALTGFVLDGGAAVLSARRGQALVEPFSCALVRYRQTRAIPASAHDPRGPVVPNALGDRSPGNFRRRRLLPKVPGVPCRAVPSHRPPSGAAGVFSPDTYRGPGGLTDAGLSGTAGTGAAQLMRPVLAEFSLVSRPGAAAAVAGSPGTGRRPSGPGFPELRTGTRPYPLAVPSAHCWCAAPDAPVHAPYPPAGGAACHARHRAGAAARGIRPD